MTRFKVPIREILGQSYYRYELYANKYNAKTGTTITVTCQARNVFGNPVKGKELKLTYKGISQGSVTTDDDGMAVWTINVGDVAGTYKLAVNQQYCFITITGYRVVKSYSSEFYSLAIDDLTRTARLSFKCGQSRSFPSGESYVQAEGWIPSDYRPATQMFTPVPRTGRLIFYCLTNGEVGIYNTYSSSVSTNSSASIYYNF